MEDGDHLDPRLEMVDEVKREEISVIPLHSAFIARGEMAELPLASMDDRKTWPKRSLFTHSSIVNG